MPVGSRALRPGESTSLYGNDAHSAFWAISRFWTVVGEMCNAYFSSTPTVSLATAENIYGKLLSWAGHLPEHLMWREKNASHVLNIQYVALHPPVWKCLT